MSENITPEQYRSEISALNREIFELERRLESSERKRIADESPDKFDPFDNPTEYRGFSGSYSKILPEIDEPGCNIPLEPGYQERRRLRKYYSIGGGCILAQFAASTLLGFLLSSLVLFILSKDSPVSAQPAIYEYIRTSSIAAGLNQLIYLAANILAAFAGLKLAGIRPTVLIRTKDFGFTEAVQYCLAGFLIWTAAVYTSTGVLDIFSHYSINTNVGGSADIGKTPLGTAIMLMYTLIIAPITEEILFRGMFLRVVSRANQRFAVFASAVMFGLCHGNITQFIIGFSVGVFMAHITLKHGSVIPSVILHIFINSMSYLLSKLGDVPVSVQFICNMLMIALAILGLIMLLVFRAGGDKLPAVSPKQSRRGIAVASGSVLFLLAYMLPALYMLYLIVKNN